MELPIVCTPVSLPEDEWIAAAFDACLENPCNMPALGLIDTIFDPGYIAVLTSKYWGSKGVVLSVQFLDNPDAETRRMILSDEIGANAWGKFGNVQFRETTGQGQVRIARGQGGYWSYLGTDNARIPLNQPTMNLQGFTSHTEVSEYRRVVKHEFGHAIGCPHEHMRREIVNLLDPNKTIAYFQRTQGWGRAKVIQQVLTPLDEGSLLGPTPADVTSIMCYQLPGECTKSGLPITGGDDIDPSDGRYIGGIYPKSIVVPQPPPSVEGKISLRLDVENKVVEIPPGWTAKNFSG